MQIYVMKSIHIFIQINHAFLFISQREHFGIQHFCHVSWERNTRFNKLDFLVAISYLPCAYFNTFISPQKHHFNQMTVEQIVTSSMIKM